MSRPRLGIGVALVVVCLCLVAGVASGAVTGSDSTDAADAAAANATLVSAYPNQVARGNPGEFVAVRFSEPTDAAGWTITDGKTTAGLPNGTFEGAHAFAVNPETAAEHTDHPVAEFDGHLSLADGGETLELRVDGRTVDTARYRNAPESEIRDFETGTWRPVGATDIPVTHTDGGVAEAFVLPDADSIVVETLERAEERILLGGYTLTSVDVTDALIDADARGVEVRVLLDGAPVGGIDRRGAAQLDRLAEAGVEPRLLSGDHSRYRHHHPKYAVVDDRVLVTTENFKPAGTGGMSSRGWGVVLSDVAATEAFSEIHRADWTWKAATAWQNYRVGRDFAASDPALGSFETRHPPQRIDVESTTVLAAPDNAADALSERLAAAEERILVQQVDIDSRDNRLLSAVLDAARRGVEVRIHLADAWYVEDENEALVDWLNRQSEAEGLDLEARIDDPDGYEKIHTKGVIVDDTVVLGSLNWGRTAKTDNREVLVAMTGSEIADYYVDVFRSDYEAGADRPMTAGLLAAVAVSLSGVVLLARRIEFRGRDEVITDWEW